MNKKAIITGATSGIGLAAAKALAHEGYDLIITARREELLLQRAAEITAETGRNVETLVFDVRDSEQVREAFEKLPTGKTIDLLINNAGLAVGLNSIRDGILDDWDRMIDTNVKGLLYVTKAVTPHLKTGGHGTIINIGSIAAKNVYANGNVYCATKHAVDALTVATRVELLAEGIRVGAIHPGMVDTDFSVVRFKGDKAAADKVYEGLTPLYANDIADAIVFMASRPPHVTINDMLIMPTVQANVHYTVRQIIE